MSKQLTADVLALHQRRSATVKEDV
jgi:hypothetical protein